MSIVKDLIFNEYSGKFQKDETTDKSTINTFGQHYLNGAGVATPDPNGCAASGGM
ncbi:MAG TPA: hypothetical protein VKL21_00855 [Candidatus Methanoperedens sp.]|nr:hypothetical protein [Candidatus Methanoperedens sp.]